MLVSSSPQVEWIPAEFNRGWSYTHRVATDDSGQSVVELLAKRYRHSSVAIWHQRLLAGELQLNHEQVEVDQRVAAGDCLVWNRPPWIEPAVPKEVEVIFDDDDLLVINKPAGLPVTPGGGFLDHTLTRLLELLFSHSNNLPIPKPVHRLGRFTSGLMLCARKAQTRAELAAMFRFSTAGLSSCRKIYRALTRPSSQLRLREPIDIQVPIAQFKHSRYGKVWGPFLNKVQVGQAVAISGKKLSAFSSIQLLERREHEDLLEVSITTGRPHQIRIHLAAIGIPLIGDPFYGIAGFISDHATLGEGGYFLHSHRVLNLPYKGNVYQFEAIPPTPLRLFSAQNVY